MPTIATDLESVEAWLKQRSPELQAAARDFPPGMGIQDEDGDTLYVIGYLEPKYLVLSPIDPAVDFKAACQRRTVVCAHCIRKAIITKH